MNCTDWSMVLSNNTRDFKQCGDERELTNLGWGRSFGQASPEEINWGEVGRRVDHPLWEARDTAKLPEQSFLAGVPRRLRRYTSLSHGRRMKRCGSLQHALSPWPLIQWTEDQRIHLRRRSEMAQAAGGITRARARGGGGEGGRLEWRRSSHQLRGGSGPLASCWRQGAQAQAPSYWPIP
jgi:hypothetical protein